MNIHNLVHGVNPYSEILLACLRLTKNEVGRFRDAFVHDGKICIYTRNGAGNRDCWNANDDQEDGADDWCFEPDACDEEPEELGCGDPDCVGCTITHRLPDHPLYLRDEDDDYDNTYCTVYFGIPDRRKPLVEPLGRKGWSPDIEWVTLLEEFVAERGPQFAERLQPLVSALHEAFKEAA